MLKQIIQQIKTAPKNPGVYIFYKNKIPLYIGKASNLKNRLRNYLRITDFSAKGGPPPKADAPREQASGWKTTMLHQEANRLKLIKLRSNIEALIIESRLIKKLKPPYNVLWRDDKNYFYVAFTRSTGSGQVKEKFSRIFITHQPSFAKASEDKAPNEYVGPFTEGQSLKIILRLLRRYFPYCTCKPHFRLCLNAQINYCPGYCCNKNAKPTKKQLVQYQKNIKKIKDIMTGKDKKFIKQLKDPYQLLVLEKIWKHEPYLNLAKSQEGKAKNNFLNPIGHTPYPQKVECYDISHLSGKEAVGAMTAWRLRRPPNHADPAQTNAEKNKFRVFPRAVREVCEWLPEKPLWRMFKAKKNKFRVFPRAVREVCEWLPEKPLWRMFKIRGKYTEDDPRMMEEIVSRRLNHPEWAYPDLIIIDGGITQLKAAQRALKDKKIKIISFAKPQELILGLEKQPKKIADVPQKLQNLIKIAINQTHNFVQRYHRRIRQKQFLSYN